MPATIGMPNAPVFPLPVCALTIRSRPALISCTTRSCTGIGLVQPSAAMPRRTGSERDSNVNSSGMRAHTIAARTRSVAEARANVAAMPGIARDEVVRIAALARLSMDDAEIDRMQRDLASVLRFASALAAVDTTGVEPTSHVIPLATPM